MIHLYSFELPSYLRRNRGGVLVKTTPWLSSASMRALKTLDPSNHENPCENANVSVVPAKKEGALLTTLFLRPRGFKTVRNAGIGDVLS